METQFRDGKNKKTKKRKAAAAALLGAVALLALGLAVWAFPLLHAAFLLRSAWKAGGFQYRFSVELEGENLSGQQKQFARSLAWLFGGSEPSGLSWEIAGRAADGRAYGKVYCKGSKIPVTELYAAKDMALVNVEMPYQSIREQISSQHPMLGALLPEWEYGTFLSSAQAEELFQVDLQKLFRAGELAESHKPSFWEILRILSGMERKKNENGARQFEAELGDYLVLLEIAEEKGTPVLGFQLSDQAGRKAAARCAGKVTFQKPEKITLPDATVDEEDIQKLGKLLDILKGLGRTLDKLF